jgi:PEGA domain-containing protein
VIGLNTLKVVRKNVNGIAFALSSSDLLTVLRRFYPSLAGASVTANARPSEADSTADTGVTETSSAASEIVAPTPSTEGFGQVNIVSEPDGAEIYVDGKFLGNTPATLKLAAGSHAIVLKSAGYSDYTRTLNVPKSSKLTWKASFQPGH